MRKKAVQTQAVKLKQRFLKLTPNISWWISASMFVFVLICSIVFIYFSRSLTTKQELANMSDFYEEGEHAPQFEFYSILPDPPDTLATSLNDVEQQVSAFPQQGSRVQEQESEFYQIQIGSFRYITEANNLKSALAKLGYPSHIREFNLDGVIWHRVLMGPFFDFKDAQRTRESLTAHNFESLLVRTQGSYYE